MKTTGKAKAGLPEPQGLLDRGHNRPLSPKQARFYFELCELMVAFYFGGKAMDYVGSFSRAKAGKALRGAWGMRSRTSMAVLTRLLEEGGRLYPLNQRGPA